MPRISGKTLSPKLPETIRDFIATANCVPALARSEFLFGVTRLPDGRFGRSRQMEERDYEWLASGPLKRFLPPKEEAVKRAAYVPGDLVREECERPAFQFGHWHNAVRYTISLLEELIRIRDTFDFSNQPRRKVPWAPPFAAEEFEIANKFELTSFDHPVSRYYANLKRALNGLESARLRQCEAELRGGVRCGMLFYAKRLGKKPSSACTPKHANLIRVKRFQRKVLQGQKR